jgi:hypothetical protein
MEILEILDSKDRPCALVECPKHISHNAILKLWVLSQGFPESAVAKYHCQITYLTVFSHVAQMTVPCGHLPQKEFYFLRHQLYDDDKRLVSLTRAKPKPVDVDTILYKKDNVYYPLLDTGICIHLTEEEEKTFIRKIDMVQNDPSNN